MSTLQAAIVDLRERVERAEDHYAEKRGQYETECTLFGDAWCGAEHELSAHAAAISCLREEYNALCATPDGQAFIDAERAQRSAELRAEWVAARG